MHPLRIALCWGAATVLLGGCQKPAPPVEPSSATGNDPAAAATQTDLPDARARSGTRITEADTDVTMRYSCEQGHGVAIVRGDIARVRLADGRVVEIDRVADSSPPRYAGEALSFEVGSNGATLGQDETGGFSCREAE